MFKDPPYFLPYVRIQDNAFSLKGTPLSIGYDDEFEETLGHEVGHSMVYFRTISTGTFPIGLRHTGDTVCSNGQPVTVTHNLMNQVPLQEDIDKDTFQEFTNLSLSESIPDALNVAANGTCGIIDQVTHLRNSAQLYAGCAFAGTMNPCSTLSSLRTDARDDVDVPAVDLTILGAQEPDDRSETIFAHRVAGDVPRSLTRATVFKYLVFADLDNNPATGGTPSSLGFATAFHGAELVSLVQVTPIIIDNSVAGFTTDATVWIFSSGAFVRSSDPGISAALEAEQTIGDATDGRSTTEVGPTTVVIHIPNSVRGPRSASYRVQAKTILEVGGIVSATDVLDESADELGEIIHTAFPVFPVCSVTPDPAAALSEVTASATGLLPNQPLEVLLGTIEVARGVTDATGAATLTFQLPAVPGGNHLVTMGSVGTVLTADCIVNVQVPPECEAGTDTLAPTFTFVPPDITISACKNPNIGQAKATDSCGVLVTNDAPAVFPLGTTVVTWTAIDPAGNVTTAMQRVTAILGDDVSCCPSGTNIIVGTNGHDVLHGTPGSDCILGLGGDDVITGAGGDDFISGGAGRDTIYSGTGNDVIFGGDGDDLINGGQGNDQISGGPGRDECVGGTGSNVLEQCEL